jgi:hypothetical protein
MLGDFTKGFWVSIYRGRIADAPAPSMRVMTREAPAGVALPNDGVARFRGRPVGFMGRLLTTWAAMGFRTPRLAGVHD